MKMTKADKLLIVFLVLASVALYGILFLFQSGQDAKYISIQVDGQEMKRLPFAPPGETKTYEVKTKFGRNLLEFNDNSVRVIEASCPDKLDVLQGRISKPGEIIVCLPNRLVIEVVGEGKSEIDAVLH